MSSAVPLSSALCAHFFHPDISQKTLSCTRIVTALTIQATVEDTLHIHTDTLDPLHLDKSLNPYCSDLPLVDAASHLRYL